MASGLPHGQCRVPCVQILKTCFPVLLSTAKQAKTLQIERVCQNIKSRKCSKVRAELVTECLPIIIIGKHSVRKRALIAVHELQISIFKQ